MVELSNVHNEQFSLMKDMRHGQIAEVMNERYQGEIIIRHLDTCFVLGCEDVDNCWKQLENNTLQIRILEDGEQLTIKDNK